MKWHGLHCIFYVFVSILTEPFIIIKKGSKKKSVRFKVLYKNLPVSKKSISKTPKVHIFLYHWVVQAR